jgi:dolichol-phosphate mannosyltransferase
MKNLCVIPVYNEEHRLLKVINQIKKTNFKQFKIYYLFINNGSSDKTKDILIKNKVNYINLKKNYGVGYALLTGLKFAIRNNCNTITHLAGNGKMNPKHIKLFLEKIYNEGYDFVNGSRFVKNDSNINNTPIIRKILILLASIFVSILYRKKITDCSCGYRAFKVKILKNFSKMLKQKELFTYGYEYYSYGKILINKNILSTEVPVTMTYPSSGSYTKMKPLIDWYIIIKFWILALLDSKIYFHNK